MQFKQRLQGVSHSSLIHIHQRPTAVGLQHTAQLAHLLLADCPVSSWRRPSELKSASSALAPRLPALLLDVRARLVLLSGANSWLLLVDDRKEASDLWWQGRVRGSTVSTRQRSGH